MDVQVILDVILQIINVIEAVLRLFGLQDLADIFGGG
jgi:hypothetical protein